MIDTRIRASGWGKQKGKRPEKDFVKNELQTPLRALMTILVSLTHYNIVKKIIEFDFKIDQILLSASTTGDLGSIKIKLNPLFKQSRLE